MDLRRSRETTCNFYFGNRDRGKNSMTGCLDKIKYSRDTRTIDFFVLRTVGVSMTLIILNIFSPGFLDYLKDSIRNL